MGRPRKESAQANAKQRIGEAFWKLLEEHEIREITVGMIVAEAQCNRGTFYYHFQSLEDLVESLLATEVLGTHLISESLFKMGTDDSYNIFDDLDPLLIKRLVLTVDRVGFGVAYGKIREAALGAWRFLLEPETGDISPAAEAFIDYYIGGVLCMLMARPPAIANTKVFGGDQPVPSSLIEFSRMNFRFMLNEICAAEGTPPEVVLKRVRSVGVSLKNQND